MRKHDIKAIGRTFSVLGTLRTSQPYGSGHINDTYAAVYDQGGTSVRYIHQRINHNIFTDPIGVMENIQRVTRHVTQKLLDAGVNQVSRRTLTLVPALDGNPYARDDEGNFWRTYLFIERARSYDAIETPKQAREAAKAFGAFQSQVSDLPAPRLNETIPNFHNTRVRFDNLRKAVEADVHNRAHLAKDEIAFCLEREALSDVLLDLLASGELPERITHNDTKLNNVMIDDVTSEGICVIDLDTVMPGLALYDFGDMVRTATSPTKEDELDVSKINMRMPMFEALAQGYLSTAREFMTPREKSLLPFAGKLITLEIGFRFLTDFLSGDHYFKVQREHHNLDRCRTQFKLVESIEQQEEEMLKVVEELG